MVIKNDSINHGDDNVDFDNPITEQFSFETSVLDEGVEVLVNGEQAVIVDEKITFDRVGTYELRFEDSQVSDNISQVTNTLPIKDNTNPSHYTSNNIECIDYIKQVLGLQGFVAYCRGNVMKYNHRAAYKNASPVEDLKKAAQYLEWANDTLKEIHK